MKRKSRRKSIILAAALTAQILFYIGAFSLLTGIESAWVWLRSAVPGWWGEFLVALSGGYKF